MQTLHKLSLRSLLYLVLAFVVSAAAVWQLVKEGGVSAHSVAASRNQEVAANKQQPVSDKLAARATQITAALGELTEQAEKSGKTPAIVSQIEALESELSAIQSVAAGVAQNSTAETEPNNTSGTANVIDLSTEPCAIVAGTINPSGDVDFFTFTGAPAGSRIWILTDTGGNPQIGSSRDSVIDLFAADGTTVIETDDDDGTGNGGDATTETGLASVIAGRTLTAGGTYFIRVKAFSGTIDPYRLFVTLTNVAPTPEVEANDTAATANVITSAGGQTGIRSGTLTAGDSDYYSVVAEAGNIVYVACDADPERDGTSTNVRFQFRDPADVQVLLANSGSSSGGFDAEGVNFTIVTSGTYFIKVLGASGSTTGSYALMVSTCTVPCQSITCPANITQSNDLNQCGAVVNYSNPTTSGGCGTVTCVPASGSFFPKGTTTVNCDASGTTANPDCSFTVTVNDTQPPTITCPANVTAVAAQTCPISSSATVTFAAPAASDNCPGVTVACTPPSGSALPIGTTTVTCTATDASANTATCSFTVTVFSGCLQDDSNPANVVLFNAATGEYRFCCGGTLFTGVGTVLAKGCVVTIQHNPGDRRVLIKFDGSVSTGTASLQSPPGVLKCTITDRNTKNNTCACQ
jgi:hypothetical protein